MSQSKHQKCSSEQLPNKYFPSFRVTRVQRCRQKSSAVVGGGSHGKPCSPCPARSGWVRRAWERRVSRGWPLAPAASRFENGRGRPCRGVRSASAGFPTRRLSVQRHQAGTWRPEHRGSAAAWGLPAGRGGSVLPSAVQRAVGGGTAAFPEPEAFINLWRSSRVGQTVTGIHRA